MPARRVLRRPGNDAAVPEKRPVTATAASLPSKSHAVRCRRAGSRRGLGGSPVDDIADRFLELVHDLEEVACSMSAQRALAEFDETTLQVFWKKWPHVSSWAGSLWSMLSAELSAPSSPQHDAEHHETGESG